MRPTQPARRARPAVVAGLLVVSTLVGAPAASSAAPAVAAPEVEEPTVTETAVPAVAAPRRATTRSAPATSDATVVARLDRTGTAPFSMVGVTWEEGPTDLEVAVSWRVDGRWSAPADLHVESTGEEGRAGTEPQWVGDADGVQVTVSSPSGAAPSDLSVATIDPGETPAAAAPQMSTRSYLPRPAIVSRNSWGSAAVPTTECDAPRVASQSYGAVIHHTAGSNSYAPSDSARIVRATQSYHRSSLGWCDIGYNFLVDKYGRIFEGRVGGVTNQVRGAHAGNAEVNLRTMGVSMMGTFSRAYPTFEMRKAVADLVAWRFAAHDLPPSGVYVLDGIRLNRIAGHRDVVGTECPGAYAYAWVNAKENGLRASVSRRLANAS